MTESVSNINGKYVSQDGNFTLTITNSNAQASTFDGTYVSKFTPHGPQTFAVTGRWFYTSADSSVPLSLGFTAFARPTVQPPTVPFVIEDAWTGVLTNVGKLYMTGVRSYVPRGGPGVLSSLGTSDFQAQ